MSTAEGFAHPEFLVETNALERRLGDPGLRVLDCTTNLVPDPKITYQVVPGREDFGKGHIPGAQFVDLQGDLSDKSHRLRFMLPTASRGIRGGDEPFWRGRRDACGPLQHRQSGVGDAGLVDAAGVWLRRRA